MTPGSNTHPAESDAPVQPDETIPGMDLPALGHYLAGAVGCDSNAVVVEMISGGRSNLTYLVTVGARRLVLRRPPLGHVLATAHDIGREFRVMSALHSTGLPVPAMVLFEQDVGILGAPFMLSEFVPGPVIRSAEQARSLTSQQARAVAFDLVDRLVQLHGIDPYAVGLERLGRPAGFMRRQIHRWLEQWQQSAPDDRVPMSRLAEALLERVPEDPAPAIVHGDYRLDNTILEERDPGRIAAIVDWEMSSLGDPMADIGMLATYWDPLSAQVTGAAHPISGNPGFPSIEELVERYVHARGLTTQDLPFYVAFGNYKLAGIAATIHARYLQGKTVGPEFQTAGQAIPGLVAAGLDTLARDRTGM
ncbi:MAG: phosphotransferase family protein [Jatrophihabitantaceae bacterium]